MTKSILLVGVGGQGTITAGKLLTLGLLTAGYDVKMNEIHGMSQRGGSVSSYVRYNDKGDVYSPVIDKRGADILASFEEMEALRWVDYVRPDGVIVVNRKRLPSLPMLTGAAAYPDGILQELERVAKTVVVDGPSKAAQIGSGKVTNTILLGTIIRYMGLEHIDWETVIRENVKPTFVELNLQALRMGKEMI